MSEKIDKVLSENKADEVILMAHSMGGVIARLYMKDKEKAKKAAKIFQDIGIKTKTFEKAETTEDCCYEVAEIAMEYFSKTDDTDDPKETIPNRTINWLQLHYHENINLNAIARGIGASVSSIVHQINRISGKTYKEILGEIRTAEAKKLLATTSEIQSGKLKSLKLDEICEIMGKVNDLDNKNSHLADK